MSLINEALKKVSEAERGKSPRTDFEMRAMQPATYERRTSPLIWIAIPLFVVVVAMGGFLLARTTQHPSPQISSPPQPAVAKVAAAVEQPKVAVAPTEPAKSVVPPAAVVAEPKPQPAPAVAATPAAASATQTASPAPVAQPAPAPSFRLKGILFSKNPTALINDAAVQTGGEVDGATVTKIDAAAVTLDYQGKITILKLGARQTAN